MLFAELKLTGVRVHEEIANQSDDYHEDSLKTSFALPFPAMCCDSDYRRALNPVPIPPSRLEVFRSGSAPRR
jgi:hypothetical protein